MNIRQYQGSKKYLKHLDLKDSSLTVTIREVAEEEVGQGNDTEPKAVLYFSGKEKGFVLNSTNIDSIADVHGDETAGWLGRQIELYPTKCQFGGKTVDCIRVRIPQGSAPAPVPIPAPAPVATPAAASADVETDDIPF